MQPAAYEAAVMEAGQRKRTQRTTNPVTVLNSHNTAGTVQPSCLASYHTPTAAMHFFFFFQPLVGRPGAPDCQPDASSCLPSQFLPTVAETNEDILTVSGSAVQEFSGSGARPAERSPHAIRHSRFVISPLPAAPPPAAASTAPSQPRAP
jgi:hypothetical protein